MSSPSNPMIVWADLETTGLDPAIGVPLEIAVVLTDRDLNELWAQSYVVSWPTRDLPLKSLDPFIRDMHTNNGLLDEVYNSEHGIRWIDTVISDAILHDIFNAKGALPPLAGSTISFDRAWIEKWFPKINKTLHYRNIDVSSFKEVLTRWSPDDVFPSPEVEVHRALPDIRESITALKHYRSVLLPS